MQNQQIQGLEGDKGKDHAPVGVPVGVALALRREGCMIWRACGWGVGVRVLLRTDAARTLLFFFAMLCCGLCPPQAGGGVMRVDERPFKAGVNY